eukprot:6137572-Amphidinium_carterae.1
MGASSTQTGKAEFLLCCLVWLAQPLSTVGAWSLAWRGLGRSQADCVVVSVGQTPCHSKLQ